MSDIEKLLEIMASLRHPHDGCPWDLEQSFRTIAPYTVEEAYEVADAIERGDLPGLRDELGDLLFQVVFHARMAEEEGHFAFADVVAGLCDKMVRRHPHVFGDASVAGAAGQTVAWEQHKAAERAAGGRHVLADVPRGLPALKRAAKLGKRAASVGFDWPDLAGVRAKVAEELAELDAETAAPAPDRERVASELGDVLFAVANLARHLGVDPEDALQQANNRFTGRFRHVESALGEDGRSPADATLAELEARWQEAKRRSG